MTKAPPLRDDCFVMPRGVHWTPVDEALEKLHQSLKKMKNSMIIHTLSKLKAARQLEWSGKN